MANKYYAIKVGRKTGIYNSWNECKEYVEGYPNAIYKSFNTIKDAEEFISGRDSVCFNENTEMIAYIDGSYDDTLKRYSYGVIIFLDGQKYEFSKSDNDKELIELRNVAGELKAAIFVMNYAINKKVNSLSIYYDYNGISMWASGQWKANLPFTKDYANYAKKVMKIVKINFVKVKSHTGNKYNEEVDKLARAALYNDNFELKSNIPSEIIDNDIWGNIKASKSELTLGNVVRKNKLITSNDVHNVFKRKWKQEKNLIKDIKQIKSYYDTDSDRFYVQVDIGNEMKYVIIEGEEINE
jgi:viroplasmin and RNaseH domain-containing protein